MAAAPRGGRRVWEEREPPRPKEVGKDGVHLAHHTDLTGGKLPPNQEQNARLSDEAKEAMTQMHEDDPEKYDAERTRQTRIDRNADGRLTRKGRWNVAALAEHFAIRRERVLAILALNRLEKEAIQKGRPHFPELRELARKAYGPGYPKGNGEKHIALVRTYPKYELLTPEEAEKIKVPNIDDVIAKKSKEEEDLLVEEFKERLEFNTGVTGKTISRESRFVRAPKRPDGGWNFVVKPLGKNAPPPYVGMPDGSQREPTEDEKLYIKRNTPKARKRIE